MDEINVSEMSLLQIITFIRNIMYSAGFIYGINRKLTRVRLIIFVEPDI